MERRLLGETPLDLRTLERLLHGPVPRLALDPLAAARVVASRRAVEAVTTRGQATYGINTGFGKLSSVRVPDAQLRRLQLNLVRSHAAGVGPHLDRDVCRLAFALRIANLARGHSGVRRELVEHALAVFNAGLVPVLPSRGSVGASGDLAPLAHMALVLLGEGRAWRGEREVDGAAALRAARLKPFVLRAKEGLALINGTQVSTALLADAVLAAGRLARAADIACAFTLEAYRGTDRAYDARIQALRGQPGQATAAANLRRLLRGSRITPLYARSGRVQDPYSLRCAPQVHGASRDVLAFATGTLLREVHAVTDNPLVLDPQDGAEIVSGGNFHAQPVAVAADALKIAAAEWASISERRIELLVNPDLSGLPAFLARRPGLESGLMIAQVTAAALVSENKVLAHPASVDSIPTSAGKEDHVSMAPAAALQCRQIVRHATHVVAIELMTAFHALALGRGTPGVGTRAARGALKKVLKPLKDDRVLSGDIEAVARAIDDGSVLEAVEEAVGGLE
ncbi:MAG TPA: histidine ammonia-lyase [Planctomycetota bacterium]|nr:histidine ammonia-lyase [Planctomycetota bacterium]